jgi:hypothetical protein
LTTMGVALRSLCLVVKFQQIISNLVISLVKT